VTPTYSLSGFWRGVAIATIMAGTLDILSAFLFDIMVGGSPGGVLQGIAAAACPQIDIGDMGNAGLGLVVHFAIVLAMVTAYFTAATGIGQLNRHPWLSGIGYGLLLWIVMYWIVLPHRFPTLFPVLDPHDVAIQLLDHVVLTGLPIAWVARRAAWWRRRGT